VFPVATKILVVDDFSTMRKIIIRELKTLGFSNIDEADDGITAWPKIKTAQESGQPYGFIISDWNMPEMKGIDLLKSCKKEEKLKNIPFIMLTAESEQQCIDEAKASGAADFISKPFDASTLKVKLEEIWNKSQNKFENKAA
jgi:two-component system chemotaxis response regulator CheY